MLSSTTNTAAAETDAKKPECSQALDGDDLIAAALAGAEAGHLGASSGGAYSADKLGNGGSSSGSGSPVSGWSGRRKLWVALGSLFALLAIASIAAGVCANLTLVLSYASRGGGH